VCDRITYFFKFAARALRMRLDRGWRRRGWCMWCILIVLWRRCSDTGVLMIGRCMGMVDGRSFGASGGFDV
jgi:hypothetical protein